MCIRDSGKVLRVVARHTDAGAHRRCGGIQHQNAAARHGTCRHCFHCPLHLSLIHISAGLSGGAGGKTGTAQTGQFTAEGKERMNLWFAGFYPAEDPQYTIVVLQDGQMQAAVSSAAVFAQLCTALHWLG